MTKETNVKTFNEMAEEVFRDFDFEKVRKAMIATDWDWALGKDEKGNYLYGIPDVQTIKNSALKLLKEAFIRKSNIGTGGFFASWEDGILILEFVLIHSESD